MTNHQRVGAISNAQVGRDFEKIALSVLNKKGLSLQVNHKMDIGLGDKKENPYF